MLNPAKLIATSLWPNKCHCKHGFTLLEVMIAMAILAAVITSVLSLHSQGLSLTIESDFNTTAALLAQEKLAEYEAGIINTTFSEGDFTDSFSNYKWQLETTEIHIDQLSLLTGDLLGDPLVQVDITILSHNEQLKHVVRYYAKGTSETQ